MGLSAKSGHGASGLSPIGVILKSRNECVLSQIGTEPDMTLDVARM